VVHSDAKYQRFSSGEGSVTDRIPRQGRFWRCAAGVVLACSAMLAAGCGSSTHYPVNAPLGQRDAEDAYRVQRVAHDPANPQFPLGTVSVTVHP